MLRVHGRYPTRPLPYGRPLTARNVVLLDQSTSESLRWVPSAIIDPFMMNTATSTTVRGAKMIENVCAERYGVSALNCEAHTIEWAAEHVAKTHGVAVAAAEWKRVNARRHRLGLYTTIPQYGTAMWAAYFG